MGLAEIQTALARLYTDSELRKRFLEDSASVGGELGMKKEESEQLSKISTNELSFFSDSLIWKRLSEVEKLLPLTNKALSEKFKKHFQSFASAYNPKEIKKHLDDAIAFCIFLEKKIKTRWIVDLIRFEKTRLQFNGLNRKIIVMSFDYDLIDVMEKLSRDEKNEAPKKKKWIGVWFRFNKSGEGKFYRIG